MRLRRVLLIIGAIVIVMGLGVGIWALISRSSVKKEQKTIRNINVGPLTSANEKTLGTIVYSAAKPLDEVKDDGTNNVVNLETTDSLEGAFNIYYQDVLNRYKSYTVSKKEVTRDGALNNKARVITVSGQTGKITITLWAKTNGMTQIEIVTSKDFK